jgi:hypothetical protein
MMSMINKVFQNKCHLKNVHEESTIFLNVTALPATDEGGVTYYVSYCNAFPPKIRTSANIVINGSFPEIYFSQSPVFNNF